jgi:hypothetical protein
MPKTADITINLDEECSQCGAKGVAQNGLCLDCITKRITKGGLMEVKVLIKDIEKLKTATEVKVETDKDGEIVDRRVVTKIQFEAEVHPQELSNVHRLMAGEAPVHCIIGSPQAVMEVVEREGVFAEV